MMVTLVKLTENDKRLFVAILLVLILVFVLIGYIGMWITHVMKWQGKRLDGMMHDITLTRVVENKKQFRRVARIKNWRYFFKKSLVPLLIAAIGVILLLIAESVNNWSYDIFDYQKTGFGTLLFLWDFSDPNIYVNFFGMTIIAAWPGLLNSPHFESEAIFSYFIVPTILTGGIWYLVQLQCLISRGIRAYKLSHSLYDKSLENVNMNTVGLDQQIRGGMPTQAVPPANPVPPYQNSNGVPPNANPYDPKNPGQR